MNERRVFVKRMLTAALFMVGGGAMAGCGAAPNNKGKDGEGGEGKDDPTKRFGGNCDDFSKLTEADHQVRKKLGYDPVSPREETQCQHCNLWLPPRPKESCGGCTLFSGPIEPKGTCTYWAPRQS